jgi:hypothetical protein
MGFRFFQSLVKTPRVYVDRRGGPVVLRSTRTLSPYTIVLWVADANRYISFAAAHLLHEGLSVANQGRIDNEIPVSVGVANARRRPIISREASASGLIFGRDPVVSTPERHDYLMTFTSGDQVDALRFRAPTTKPRVIVGEQLITALDGTSPQSMSKSEILSRFAAVSQIAKPISVPHDDHLELRGVADLCLRLVEALSN